jgi:DNA-nicking Smr family endonuclease
LPTFLRILSRSTNASVLNTFTLDLHGQHVEEALQSLERYVRVAPGAENSER